MSDPDEPGSGDRLQWSNPDSEELEILLERSRRIAVVGLSSDPSRPSNGVAAYLLSQGYEVIPVNPNETAPLGLAAYPDLGSIPGKVDIIDVFRRAEYTPEIVRQAIALGAPAVWLQEGIVSLEAYQLAKESGLTIVMNRCILKEHSRLK